MPEIEADDPCGHCNHTADQHGIDWDGYCTQNCTCKMFDNTEADDDLTEAEITVKKNEVRINNLKTERGRFEYSLNEVLEKKSHGVNINDAYITSLRELLTEINDELWKLENPGVPNGVF